MGTTYTRQSSFSDGDTITAALFNNEYNQILNAFAYASSGTTGHQHDGTAAEGGNIHTIGDQDFLNKIVADSTNNRWGFFVEVSSSAVEQVRIQDGAIVPVTDNDIDLGTSSLEFKDGYFDGTVYADAINFNGTAIAATAAELNIMDGDTSATSTTLADADRVVVNDGGTMKQVALTDFETYFESSIDTIANFEVTTELQTPLIAFTDGDDAIQIADGGGVTMAAGLTSTAAANSLGATSFNDADITNVGDIQLDSITGDGDTNTSVTFSGSDVITVTTGGETQITFNNGTILPTTDNDIDLGSSSYEFKDLYIDGTANIDALVADTADINGGSVDGATLGTNSAITQAVIDNVNINGATIGHTDDTDLITLADGVVTVAGELDATTLDISGNADIDGTLEADAYTVDGTTLAEYIADTAGAMVSSNTESGITVTYQDADNTIDFSVDAAQTGITSIYATDLIMGEDSQTAIDFGTANEIDFKVDNAARLTLTSGALYPVTDNQIDLGTSSLEFKDAFFDGTVTSDAFAGPLTGDVTGTSSKVTVSDSTANTNFPVVFHDESDSLLDDTGALRYNPSTGTLLVPNLSVAGTTTTVDTVTMEASNAIIFEGATADAHETTLSIVDPTADHTQYLINQGGYIPVLAAATTTAITSTPAELNVLDNVTAGTVSASLGVVVDSNKDIGSFRNVTLTGELDAATLDISGNADIDGTTNLDAVDIDGATQIDATVTVGVDDTGYDVKFFGATSGAYMLWDESADDLKLVGAAGLTVAGDIDVDGTSNLDVVDIDGAVDMASTLGVSGVVTANAGVVVDEMTIDGDTLTATDDFIIDAAADITLDADGGDWRYKDGGTSIATWSNVSGTYQVKVNTQDADFKILGDDGGSEVTALTLDMSAAGAATFNDAVKLGDSSVLSLGAGSDIEIYSDGTHGTIGAQNGDLTLDVAGDIILDADGGDFRFKDAGTTIATYSNVSSDWYITANVQDKDIVFQGNDGGSTIQALTLDMSDAGSAYFNNKVGVGETSPLAQLHVKTADSSIGTLNASANTLCLEGSTNAGLTIASATNANSMIAFGDSGDADIGFINYDHNADVLAFNVNASERMRILSGGNLCIGRTNATWNNTAGINLNPGSDSAFINDGQCLSLNRTDSHGVVVGYYYDGSSVGSISTNANSLPSDRNFKRDISDLDLGLNLVNKLKPSQYNYKIDSEDCPKMYGLVAQDLEQSLEEVGIEKNSTWLLQHEPNEDEKQSDYNLDYLKLTPILIKAIQEQQEQIEALQSEINILKGGD